MGSTLSSTTALKHPSGQRRACQTNGAKGLDTAAQVRYTRFGIQQQFDPTIPANEERRLASPTSVRHSFARRSVRGGVSPFVLMRLLGHSDIKTTMRYVHASRSHDLAAALDKMA